MEAIQHIKLSELADTIAGVIRGAFQNTYWVVGEISSHSFYRDKDRHYFELIENLEGGSGETIKIKGRAWSEGSRCIAYFESKTGQKFHNGLQVLVKVKVEYHPVYGLTLVVLDIDDAFTLGNIEKQRRETLERLVRDNEYIKKVGDEFVTRNKQITLNFVLQKIALVGSANSEGYTDFIHTLQNNKFGYKFFTDTYYSSVQGADAEVELVGTLIKIYQSGKNYDCVVIIRGGGAKTDFLVFDTYTLSQAVAKFPIPVITGIGHHKDVSIVDMMAHTITKTPTKAAEFIISHNHTYEEGVLKAQQLIVIKSQQLLANNQRLLTHLNKTVISGTNRTLSHSKDVLVQVNQTVVNKSVEIINSRKTKLFGEVSRITTIPKIIVANKLNSLANTQNNFKIFTNKYITNRKGNLNHYVSYVNAVSPEKTLKRGFAVIHKNDEIIPNGLSVNVGDNLKIIFADSEINSKVISKTERYGNNI